MNWRLVTAINALIPIVTISVGIYAVCHIRHSQPERRPTDTELNSRNKTEDYLWRADNLRDITSVRVDKLASVPPSELYEVLSSATPEQILALAMKFNDLPSDAPTLGAVEMFFKTLAQINGNAALVTAFRIKDVRLRRAAASAVVDSVSPALCGDLAAHLRDHPDTDLMSENNGSFLDTLLQRWAFVDAAAAAKFLDELGDAADVLSYETKDRIGRAWGTVDPSQALAWADKHTYPTSNDQDVLFSDTIAGWCTTDLAAASSYVTQHIDRQGGKESADTVLRLMLEHDGDGKGATKWLSELPSSLRKKEIEGNFACVWAQRDASASARWVETLPGDEQPAAVSGLMVVWAGHNWPAALEWINGIAGELRDHAINSAINCCGLPENISPAQAISLALSITNSDLRFDTLKDALSHWAIENREAAVGWVKRSSLPEEQKRSVLSLDMLSPQKSEHDSNPDESSE